MKDWQSNTMLAMRALLLRKANKCIRVSVYDQYALIWTRVLILQLYISICVSENMLMHECVHACMYAFTREQE